MSDQSSNLMKLELLDKEFTLLLDQYQQISKNYFSLTKSNSNKLNTIQGREIIGGELISFQSSPSLNSCQALCSNNSNCSGANYDTETHNCIIKSGKINLDSTNNKNNYSIISEKNNLLIQLNSINESLYNVLNRSVLLVKSMNPNSELQTRQVSIETEKLLIKNNLLTENKKETQQLIDENNDLDNILKKTNLMVEQSNLSYFLWTMGVIILIIICIKIYLMN